MTQPISVFRIVSSKLLSSSFLDNLIYRNNDRRMRREENCQTN